MLPAKSVAEFFAGIGLMRMGLEEAGWRTVFANDIDRKKREMYETHFGTDGTFVLDDVHKLDVRAVPSVELATASFPCNDLSLAGGRRGLAGEQSSAFWGFIRVLREMGRRRPPIVLLENVSGFLTSHGGNDLCDALLALNGLGYAVDALLVDAAHFVPQSRVRLFIVGSRKQGAGRRRKAPEVHVSPLRPPALCEFIQRHPEIAWRLRPLPAPSGREAKLVDLLEKLPANAAAWWSAERAEYLLGQMSERHRAEAETMIRGKSVRYATVFRRVRDGRCMAELRADGVAGCLRTPRGGSGRQILFAAGRGRFAARLLTARECARLMGADDFTLKVPLNQALFGFGDAVCVPVIRWIAENYLNPLREEIVGKAVVRRRALATVLRPGGVR